MKLTTVDVQKAISFLIEHINAGTGDQVVAVVTRMSELMQSLYDGISSMTREEVRSLKDSAYISTESRVLISTVAASLKDKERLARSPKIQEMAQIGIKSRSIKMPTLDGIIEASQFIIDNMKMAGDMLVELNKLFQAFSDAKTYAAQDNSGTRALLTQKEAAVLRALQPEKETKKSYTSKSTRKEKKYTSTNKDAE
jgi:hypothetical protein